jgi:hypothetical protein
MIRRLIGIVAGCVLLVLVASAFVSVQDPKGGIVGTVVNDRGPLIAAAITVHELNDTAVITTAVSGPEGRFAVLGLRNGNYYLKISYIGYQSYNTRRIVLSREAAFVDLGVLKLQPAVFAAAE